MELGAGGDHGGRGCPGRGECQPVAGTKHEEPVTGGRGDEEEGEEGRGHGLRGRQY